MSNNSRRDFIWKSALMGLGGLAHSMAGETPVNTLEFLSSQSEGNKAVFNLPTLPYAYNALEPYIDKQTMEIHHTKHHKAYVDKLNGADLSKISTDASDADKCRSVNAQTEAIIRNNLGGHYNHSLFWQLMRPPQSVPNLPGGRLGEAIQSYFKSYADFNKEFLEKAAKIFGSGWCWLVVDEQKRLKICTTSNQDNPLMQVAAEKGTPVLALDVWEHAYYIKYQNRRADYINNWWQIVNWQTAEELFTHA